MNNSSNGSLDARPNPMTIKAAKIAITLKRLPSWASLICNGVCSRFSLPNKPAILPISVCIPMAVTTPVPRPFTTAVPRYT